MHACRVGTQLRIYTSNTFLEVAAAAAAAAGPASTLGLSQAQTFDYLHLMTPLSPFLEDALSSCIHYLALSEPLCRPALKSQILLEGTGKGKKGFFFL